MTVDNLKNVYELLNLRIIEISKEEGGGGGGGGAFQKHIWELLNQHISVYG